MSWPGVGASAGFVSPRGVAVCARTGKIFVSDFGSGTLRSILPAGVVTTVAGGSDGAVRNGADGLAAGVKLNAPRGMAVDGRGDLWVATSGGIKRLSTGSPAAPLMIDTPYLGAGTGGGGSRGLAFCPASGCIAVAETNANFINFIS